MIERFLGIKYNFFSSDNFNVFLDAVGIDIGEAGLLPLNTMELRKCECSNTYTLISTSPQKTTLLEFQAGIEFTTELKGKIAKVMVIIFDHKLHQSLTLPNEKHVVIDYIFYDGFVKILCKIDKIVATKIYTLHINKT